MKILIPANPLLKLDLPDGVEAIVHPESAPVPAQHRDAQAVVLWGMAGSQVKNLADSLPNLKWVQTLAAGPDAVLQAGLPPHIRISIGKGLHDKTVAEHALALTLGGLRRFCETFPAQQAHRWLGKEIGATQPLHPTDRVTTLIDSNVLIWGFGAIGQETGRLFSHLGANVTGVAQSSGERAGFPVVDYPQMKKLLPQTDVLVMVLPNRPNTYQALNAELLSLLPNRAWIINVGRGTTIDEEALAQALLAKTIGGAGLDVTQIEPLPENSPLWDLPNVIITPHAAGGRPLGAEERISRNIRAFLAGQPLEAEVTR